ncbi:hypothetical protein U27_01856 [Candidatus Vecturithrix granuli]|uniref:N-acetylneuraminate lyase n=1 Tax=Vecturithrix granuli TaxID=1499967 RepID=A0A0S6W9T2_VECG1|nr:hypothetical protein U27_01856 [Candidatus Vecturithrix granuli]
MKNNIEGIYAAIVTPMTATGEVNLYALRSLVRWELKHGVEGFYVCGSSGEGLLLSLSERKQVLETVLDETGGHVSVVAHTGTIRTDDVIELARHAAEAGAVAVSMIPPYYYHFNQEEIVGYYEDVLRAVNIPIIIYNIPAFTGVSFTRGSSARLLAHSQIVGIKHTSVNLYDLERMKAAYPEKIYFNGYDEIFLSGLAAGATAAIGTTVNLFPKLFKEIRALYLAGNMQNAAELQHKLNTAVEVFLEVGIFNAVKYAFTLRGIECGSCRRPFIPLTDDQKQRIQALLGVLETS